MSEQQTPYERFGGHEFFASLVHSFYERVQRDPILSPMYPDHDFTGAEERLRMFLEQYWGGPTTYNETRGHPMLRMRHMPFAIDAVARDRWLTLMHDAIVDQAMPEALEMELWKYLVSAAFAMQNITEEPSGAIPVTEA